MGEEAYVWGAMNGPAGVALVQISRVTQLWLVGGPPAHYFVTREHAGWNGACWFPLEGGLAEGSPNFALFLQTGVTSYWHLHYRNCPGSDPTAIGP